MVDLEDQLRESSKFTDIIATPLESGEGSDSLEDELQALMEEDQGSIPVTVSSMKTSGDGESPIKVMPPTPLVPTAERTVKSHVEADLLVSG
jgi:hypothetical protein